MSVRYDVLLLDIEGTTTPISFVQDVLFPFAARQLEPHLLSTYDQEQTRQDVRALIALSRKDQQDGVSDVVVIPEDPVFLDASREPTDQSLMSRPSFARQLAAVLANVRWQMALDRKSTALKQLQGHIWAEGYSSGQLQGTVYDDVVAAFERWQRLPRPPRLCVYSSGSVEAQRLIFGHTQHGSLSRFLHAYFDTTVGAKQEADSYRRIMEQLKVQPQRLLFLTDVEAEARACIKAGGEALIVVRRGNKPVDPACGVGMIHSFDELHLHD